MTSSPPNDLSVAVLLDGPGQEPTLLPVILSLRRHGAEVMIAVAPGTRADRLAAAGLDFCRDNSYLEAFIGRSGRKCFLWSRADLKPDYLGLAVVGLCEKLAIPTVDAGSDPEATVQRILREARPAGTPAGRSHCRDGRPLFDDLGYERYVRLMGIAEQVNRDFPGRFSLLDIGGEDEAIKRFLPLADYANYDGMISRTTSTGHPDGAFDVVLAADVLEHVDPADRPAFLTELVRVARHRVVFSFPCAGAAPFEQFLLEVMPRHRWLAEHRERGLPEAAEVDKILDSLKLSYTRASNHSLQAWAFATLFDHLPLDDGLRRAVNLFHQENAYPLEGGEPSYRHIYTVRV